MTPLLTVALPFVAGQPLLSSLPHTIVSLLLVGVLAWIVNRQDGREDRVARICAACVLAVVIGILVSSVVYAFPMCDPCSFCDSWWCWLMGCWS